MHLLYHPDDPHLLESLLYIVRKAIEGPLDNVRVQIGSVTLSCTANTQASGSVTFAKPFKQGTTPIVLPGITSLGTAASQVTPSAVNASPTGFTAQAFSSVTQSVTLAYVAIGQV